MALIYPRWLDVQTRPYLMTCSFGFFYIEREMKYSISGVAEVQLSFRVIHYFFLPRSHDCLLSWCVMFGTWGLDRELPVSIHCVFVFLLCSAYTKVWYPSLSLSIIEVGLCTGLSKLFRIAFCQSLPNTPLAAPASVLSDVEIIEILNHAISFLWERQILANRRWYVTIRCRGDTMDDLFPNMRLSATFFFLKRVNDSI